MPKKNKNTRNNRGSSLILCVLLLLVGCGIGFLIANKIRADKIGDAQQKSDSQVADSTDENAVDKSRDADIANFEKQEDKTPVKYDGEDPNTLENITGDVTRADVSDGRVVIRVNINQYLGSGTCTLTMGNYSASANVVANASTSSCEGFDINLSELSGLSGDTGFTINVVSGDKAGSINGNIAL